MTKKAYMNAIKIWGVAYEGQRSADRRPTISLVSKTVITLTKKTVGRPSANLSADNRPIYRPIKCQILALFSSADKK